MNLEQRRREVRKYTQIRRTYNLDLEESTMSQARNKISKIANDMVISLVEINDELTAKKTDSLALVTSFETHR